MDATQTQAARPRVQRKAKHTILFLAANPLAMDRRTLDLEARAIQAELERSGHRDQFELVTRWAVEPLDLLRELRKLKPTVVHFSGHGDSGEPRQGATLRRDVVDECGPPNCEPQGGLFFQGPDGRPQLVSTAALLGAFGAAGSSVKLVVLNACYSEAQANPLLSHVDCIVGMTGAIQDCAARSFAIGFYGGLGECESVAAAFRQGVAAIDLTGLTSDDRRHDVMLPSTTPCNSSARLLTRPGTDPNSIYIIHKPDEKTRCSIVIKANLKEFDADTITRVRDQLRLLTGDVSLEIVEIQEGSVRLTITLSHEAATQLEMLSERGQLSRIGGFVVSSVRVHKAAESAAELPRDTRLSGARLGGPSLDGPSLGGGELGAADLCMVARALGLTPGSVAAVIAMLDEGNTVPFIARYRKERTGGLDEVQIRAIEDQRTYIVELEARRTAILVSVAEQGKLTPELEARLRAVRGKSELEDLYAAYRRRKTRASVAHERGLESLAQRILAQGSDGDPAAEAAAFVGEAVASADDALAGARDIVAEVLADTAEIRAFARREYAEHGELVSEVVPGKGDEPTKFEQYYQFKEAVKSIPSHRFLAIRRGEAEGVLRAHVAVDTARVEAGILRLARLDDGSPWAGQLRQAAADALKRLLAPSVENDVRAELKQRSDGGAVEIFAGNLRNLLLAAPLGSAAVVGIDPGLRTGCKCAAIDATGKFLGTVTVYISQGDAQLARAKDDFVAFLRRFTPRAIAVGNGTGGREAEGFIKHTLAEAGLRAASAEGASGDGHAAEPAGPFVVQVNEAGASVYSASDLAREEFPELDLTIRGAISIARRLQDPLAELVKIEPKSIGVGQYQHDVHQPLLAKKLGDVIEDCVNHVGVELNTASAQLLSYVAGIGKALARKIVLHRDSHGAFASRAQLMDVSGLGPKAFEQAAGFLRIANAAFPLDRSAVHPERYPLVEQIARDLGVELPQLVGNQELVDRIDLSKYATDEVGEPTLRDIAAELVKPGRDPRAEFSPPRFRDDVTAMEDLKVGMVLEGIVTSVTAFGAFVDIGVHNDGLVHVSQLAEQFVKDPSEVVKVGQKLTVRVLEVDNQRKRIALSAKKGEGGLAGSQASAGRAQAQGHQPQRQDDPRVGRGRARNDRRPQQDRVRGERGGLQKGSSRRVLIVDDHPDSADASCMLLSALGYECRPAVTGENALAEVERFQPDVVICAIGLPDISGYDIARTLRSRHGSSLYLAALTGSDQPSARARALAAGFDEYLVKPANARALRAVMVASMRALRPSVPASSRPLNKPR